MQQEQADLAALIRATASGEQAALGALYERTAAKLLGVVVRIVRDRGQAEDVLQEVYIRVWQNARSYSPEAGRPMTWLITIARNRAIDVVRARREVAMPQNADGRDISEQVADPRDREAELVASDELKRCLDRLDDIQRRCLLDAYHDGLSREELAARYARPVNTIKTWLHRTAHSLRSCIEEGWA